MFIKKDARKITEILADDSDPREELRLGRRSSEFRGEVKALISSRTLPRLQKLKRLSVYDNNISSVRGLGLLAGTPLEELSLGKNELTSLHAGVGKLVRLQRLWADDNALQEFPACLLELRALQELRLTGNRIPSLPTRIGDSGLKGLRVLAVDNNNLQELPESLGQLTELRSLLLRQNELRCLPSSLGGLKQLTLLSVSSNKLKELPPCCAELTALETLYANGNDIALLASGVSSLPALRKVNLANNHVSVLPKEWVRAFGEVGPQSSGGSSTMGGDREGCVLNLLGNPIMQAQQQDKEKGKIKQGGEEEAQEEEEEEEEEEQEEGEEAQPEGAKEDRLRGAGAGAPLDRPGARMEVEAE